MNLYAEHGCIFILLFRTVNRHIHSRLLTCALTYKELAGLILFQKAKKKNKIKSDPWFHALQIISKKVQPI